MRKVGTHDLMHRSYCRFCLAVAQMQCSRRIAFAFLICIMNLKLRINEMTTISIHICPLSC